MKFYNNKKPAFTLMEILIASAIFATVLVFVSGTIAQTSSYYTKVKVLKRATQTANTLADLITRDVRSAVDSGEIVINSDAAARGDGLYAGHYKKGVALFVCAGPVGNNKEYNSANDYCRPIDQDDPHLQDNTGSGSFPQLDGNKGAVDYAGVANVLVTMRKDNFTVLISRYFTLDKSRVFYRSIPYGDATCAGLGAGLCDKNGIDMNGIYNALLSDPVKYTIADTNFDNRVILAGYAPRVFATPTSTQKQQPYIQFFVSAQNYGDSADQIQSPTAKARCELRSSVTVRNYDPI